MLDLLIYNINSTVWLGILSASLPIFYYIIHFFNGSNNPPISIITPVALIISILLYYTVDIGRSSITVMSIMVVFSILEFMFALTVYSQMGDCTETFRNNANISLMLDSSIIFVTIAYILQYAVLIDIVIIYLSIVIGILTIIGIILLYPTCISMIRSRRYELTNNDEQEVELGINDDQI